MQAEHLPSVLLHVSRVVHSLPRHNHYLKRDSLTGPSEQVGRTVACDILRGEDLQYLLAACGLAATDYKGLVVSLFGDLVHRGASNIGRCLHHSLHSCHRRLGQKQCLTLRSSSRRLLHLGSGNAKAHRRLFSYDL